VAAEEATWRLAEALADRDRVVAVVETSALPAIKAVVVSAATAAEAPRAVAVEAIANPAAMAVATEGAANG